MISRKDNLLIRPWIQKRYENHRRKVKSAVAAIDNKPPLPRQHVAVKLKKMQKEQERITQIEKNNLNLLRRLSFVMRTNRVDNYWKTPQPNFLNRVAVFDVQLPNIEDLLIEDDEKIVTQENSTARPSSRKNRCLACTPQEKNEILIPEERVPWEPDKKPVSRLRSRSVPAKRVAVKSELPKNKPKSANNEDLKKSRLNSSKKNKICEPENNKGQSIIPENNKGQSIILSRGCLKLAVNFPPDTFVKIRDGSRDQILLRNICNCKNTMIKI